MLPSEIDRAIEGLDPKDLVGLDLGEVRRMLEILDTPGVAGFDLETTFARTYDREVCTMQAAHADGREAFLYVYQRDSLIRLVFRACAEGAATLAAHFAIFETEMAMKYGSDVEFMCTFIAARVLRGVVPGNGIDPNFSLKGLMWTELGEEVGKEVRKSDWTQPPDAPMIEYALGDARGTRDLWLLYEYELSEDPDQMSGFRIINDALPAIAECNLNGLMFDPKAHDRMCIAQRDEQDAYLLALDIICDGAIKNHGSPKQVSDWIAEQISFEPGCSAYRAGLLFWQITGTPWKLTASKQLSLDKDYTKSLLEVLEPLFPNLGMYLRHRALFNKSKKLLEAFGPTLAEKLDPDGHIRGSLIPHGARTSRQSCRQPNLQQMPNEEFMRAMFTRTREGRVIAQADYEQVELVVGCVICDDRAMKEVFRRRQDIHSATAANIAGIPYAAFDKNDPKHQKLRTGGKPVTFAALYGAQASTIALNSGLPMLEANQLLDDWLDAYPGIKAYRESEPERAHEAGFTQLVSGQKVKVREDSRGPQLINIRVQGGAASVMYLALTYVYRALKAAKLDAVLCLCVHDEILLDCAEADAIAAGHILEAEMTRAIYDLFPEVRDIKQGTAAEAAIVLKWSDKDRPECKLSYIERMAA